MFTILSHNKNHKQNENKINNKKKVQTSNFNFLMDYYTCCDFCIETTWIANPFLHLNLDSPSLHQLLTQTIGQIIDILVFTIKESYIQLGYITATICTIFAAWRESLASFRILPLAIIRIIYKNIVRIY